MSLEDEKMALAEAQADKDTPMQTTVREFIGWFGYERRGWRVIKDIRKVLSKHNLITIPDFEHIWFDGFIHISRPPTESITPEATDTDEQDSTSTGDPTETTTVTGAVEDAAYRIGKLGAANTIPTRVHPNSSIEEAITILLRDNFSQLPVMTNDRDVKGAITWQSIAKRVGLGHVCKKVEDCLDHQVEIVNENVSLFRVIELIRDRDFVLVRATDRRIIGIVTVADLSETLDELGRPFLLLSEIENHIRGMIDGRFSPEELQEIKNPADESREVTDVSDLTFGEYVRLLQNPEKWKKIGLAIDRGTFIKDLERVNQIRNDVMHFDPDGIGPDDLEELRKTARFVQELRELVKE